MTAKPLFREILQELAGIYTLSEATEIGYLLMGKYAGLDKTGLIRNPDIEINSQQEKLAREALKRLRQHEPIQYVLGEAPFRGMMLKVNPGVLIPRPETEELVELIINDCKNRYIQILDIGTGSGCIAISLKCALIHSAVSAIDISEKALETARQNANQQNTAVHFLRLDILNEADWSECGSYDVLVSNPPYISIEEKSSLEKHVVDYEPSLALFAPDKDPLVFYRKIAAFCLDHLKPEGAVYLEINNAFASETLKIMIEAGLDAHLIKDMFGNDRFIRANRSR